MQQIRTIHEGYARILFSVRSLSVYAAAGAVGTTVHFAVLFVTLHWVPPVAASTLGAIAGCIVNYFLARRLVFGCTQPCMHSFPRFLTVALFGLILNAAVIQTFVNALPILLNQLLATSAVLLTGFTLNKRWTFSDR